MAETVTLRGHGNGSRSSWSPDIGDELTDFLDCVHEDARERVRDQTLRIMGRAIPPARVDVRAELVVGYVQAGKTMSFTAAAAMARDNGHGLVIVIAGTSQKLLDQTRDRLRKDLKLDDPAAYQRWIQVDSPKRGSDQATRIAAVLDEWVDPDVPQEEVATVLVTVMKHHQHLQWLAEVLEEVGANIDLARISTLLIDDEADQASPNVKKKEGEESTTYARIRRVRDALPAHTLLEYTATPQAPLLMSLADSLSPDYVTVLDPGPAYTGGKYFFHDHKSDFVRLIPHADALAIDDPALGPPRSLLAAFACFALGCAAGVAERPADPPHRSMLVHPSQQTLPHEQFVTWLKTIRDEWTSVLKLEDADPDRVELIAGHLAPAYDDLAATVEGLASFESLLERLPRAMKNMAIVTVNAASGPSEPIPWSTGYAWILVGGQMLDRGFTVEGLTVTYMPRRIGVGNADTVQQRARFFGYKAKIAGFCRAWFDSTVATAFEKYVEHEEHMRDELAEVDRGDEPLKAWERRFLLDKNLRPTRAAVIRLSLDRFRFGDEWIHPWYPGSVSTVAHEANRGLVESFFSLYAPTPDADSPYFSARIPLTDALDHLIEDFIVAEEDSVKFSSLKLLLAVAADRPGAVARVVQMRPSTATVNKRAIDSAGRLKSLLQGRNESYQGDREIKDEESVTIQVHRYNLEEAGGATTVDVPIVAIWVPAQLESSVISEKPSS